MCDNMTTTAATPFEPGCIKPSVPLALPLVPLPPRSLPQGGWLLPPLFGGLPVPSLLPRLVLLLDVVLLLPRRHHRLLLRRERERENWEPGGYKLLLRCKERFWPRTRSFKRRSEVRPCLCNGTRKKKKTYCKRRRWSPAVF